MQNNNTYKRTKPKQQNQSTERREFPLTKWFQRRCLKMLTHGRTMDEGGLPSYMLPGSLPLMIAKNCSDVHIKLYERRAERCSTFIFKFEIKTLKFLTFRKQYTRATSKRLMCRAYAYLESGRH